MSEEKSDKKSIPLNMKTIPRLVINDLVDGCKAAFKAIPGWAKAILIVLVIFLCLTAGAGVGVGTLGNQMRAAIPSPTAKPQATYTPAGQGRTAPCGCHNSLGIAMDCLLPGAIPNECPGQGQPKVEPVVDKASSQQKDPCKNELGISIAGCDPRQPANNQPAAPAPASPAQPQPAKSAYVFIENDGEYQFSYNEDEAKRIVPSKYNPDRYNMWAMSFYRLMGLPNGPEGYPTDLTNPNGWFACIYKNYLVARGWQNHNSFTLSAEEVMACKK